MTDGYTPNHTTSDLTSITVDLIATGGVEIIPWIGIFVLFAVLGLVFLNFRKAGKLIKV